jgi:hypothetical protein
MREVHEVNCAVASYPARDALVHLRMKLREEKIDGGRQAEGQVVTTTLYGHRARRRLDP